MAVYALGDRVDGLYDGNNDDIWYPAVIRAVHAGDADDNTDRTYDVHYDDGEVEEHVASRFLRYHKTGTISVGTRVMGRYAGGDEWYAGRIAQVLDDGTFTIEYDDSEVEEGVVMDNIREISVGNEATTTASKGQQQEDEMTTMAAGAEVAATEQAEAVEPVSDDTATETAHDVPVPEQPSESKEEKEESTPTIAVVETEERQQSIESPAVVARVEETPIASTTSQPSSSPEEIVASLLPQPSSTITATTVAVPPPLAEEAPVATPQATSDAPPAAAASSSESPTDEYSAMVMSIEQLEHSLDDAMTTKTALSALVKYMRALPQVTADLVHARDGERLLVSLLRAHHAHAVIQCYGFVLLRRLCFLHAKSTHVLLRHGILDLVTIAMRKFPEDAILQASACGALAVFTRVHAGLTALLEHRVAHLVLATLIFHKSYSVHTRQVHYYACEVLLELCELGDTTTMAALCGDQEQVPAGSALSDLSPVSLLLFLLRQALSFDDKKASVAVATLLLCLASSHRGAASMLLALNGLGELSTVMAKYATEPGIQKYSASASQAIARCSIEKGASGSTGNSVASELLEESSYTEVIQQQQHHHQVHQRQQPKPKDTSKKTKGHKGTATKPSHNLHKGDALSFTKFASPIGKAPHLPANVSAFAPSPTAYRQQQPHQLQHSALVILDGQNHHQKQANSATNKRHVHEERTNLLFETYGVDAAQLEKEKQHHISGGIKRRQLKTHIISAASTTTTNEESWATPVKPMAVVPASSTTTTKPPNSSRSEKSQNGSSTRLLHSSGETSKKTKPVVATTATRPTGAVTTPRSKAFQLDLEQTKTKKETASSSTSVTTTTATASKRTAPENAPTNESLTAYAAQLFKDESEGEAPSQAPVATTAQERERLSFAEKLHKMIDKAKSSLAHTVPDTSARGSARVTATPTKSKPGSTAVVIKKPVPSVSKQPASSAAPAVAKLAEPKVKPVKPVVATPSVPIAKPKPVSAAPVRSALKSEVSLDKNVAAKPTAVSAAPPASKATNPTSAGASKSMATKTTMDKTKKAQPTDSSKPADAKVDAKPTVPEPEVVAALEPELEVVQPAIPTEAATLSTDEKEPETSVAPPAVSPPEAHSSETTVVAEAESVSAARATTESVTTTASSTGARDADPEPVPTLPTHKAEPTEPVTERPASPPPVVSSMDDSNVDVAAATVVAEAAAVVAATSSVADDLYADEYNDFDDGAPTVDDDDVDALMRFSVSAKEEPVFTVATVEAAVEPTTAVDVALTDEDKADEATTKTSDEHQNQAEHTSELLKEATVTPTLVDNDGSESKQDEHEPSSATNEKPDTSAPIESEREDGDDAATTAKQEDDDLDSKQEADEPVASQPVTTEEVVPSRETDADEEATSKDDEGDASGATTEGDRPESRQTDASYGDEDFEELPDEGDEATPPDADESEPHESSGSGTTDAELAPADEIPPSVETIAGETADGDVRASTPQPDVAADTTQAESESVESHNPGEEMPETVPAEREDIATVDAAPTIGASESSSQEVSADETRATTPDSYRDGEFDDEVPLESEPKPSDVDEPTTREEPVLSTETTQAEDERAATPDSYRDADFDDDAGLESEPPKAVEPESTKEEEPGEQPPTSEKTQPESHEAVPLDSYRDVAFDDEGELPQPVEAEAIKQGEPTPANEDTSQEVERTATPDSYMDGGFNDEAPLESEPPHVYDPEPTKHEESHAAADPEPIEQVPVDEETDRGSDTYWDRGIEDEMPLESAHDAEEPNKTEENAEPTPSHEEASPEAERATTPDSYRDADFEDESPSESAPVESANRRTNDNADVDGYSAATEDNVIAQDGSDETEVAHVADDESLRDANDGPLPTSQLDGDASAEVVVVNESESTEDHDQGTVEQTTEMSAQREPDSFQGHVIDEDLTHEEAATLAASLAAEVTASLATLESEIASGEAVASSTEPSEKDASEPRSIDERVAEDVTSPVDKVVSDVPIASASSETLTQEKEEEEAYGGDFEDAGFSTQREVESVPVATANVAGDESVPSSEPTERLLVETTPVESDAYGGDFEDEGEEIAQHNDDHVTLVDESAALETAVESTPEPQLESVPGDDTVRPETPASYEDDTEPVLESGEAATVDGHQDNNDTGDTEPSGGGDSTPTEDTESVERGEDTSMRDGNLQLPESSLPTLDAAPRSEASSPVYQDDTDSLLPVETAPEEEPSEIMTETASDHEPVESAKQETADKPEASGDGDVDPYADDAMVDGGDQSEPPQVAHDPGDEAEPLVESTEKEDPAGSTVGDPLVSVEAVSPSDHFVDAEETAPVSPEPGHLEPQENHAPVTPVETENSERIDDAPPSPSPAEYEVEEADVTTADLVSTTVADDEGTMLEDVGAAAAPAPTTEESDSTVAHDDPAPTKTVAAVQPPSEAETRYGDEDFTDAVLSTTEEQVGPVREEPVVTDESAAANESVLSATASEPENYGEDGFGDEEPAFSAPPESTPTDDVGVTVDAPSEELRPEPVEPTQEEPSVEVTMPDTEASVDPPSSSPRTDEYDDFEAPEPTPRGAEKPTPASTDASNEVALASVSPTDEYEGFEPAEPTPRATTEETAPIVEETSHDPTPLETPAPATDEYEDFEDVSEPTTRSSDEPVAALHVQDDATVASSSPPSDDYENAYDDDEPTPETPRSTPSVTVNEPTLVVASPPESKDDAVDEHFETDESPAPTNEVPKAASPATDEGDAYGDDHEGFEVDDDATKTAPDPPAPAVLPSPPDDDGETYEAEFEETATPRIPDAEPRTTPSAKPQAEDDYDAEYDDFEE